jgi:hypothetical protein
MTHKRLLPAVFAALLAMGVAGRSQALFGVGDIVFDPSVFAQAVEQVLRLEQQYAQLVQSYQMIRNQYEQMRWNARQVPVDMGSRYRVNSTVWAAPRARDAYGTTEPWTRAAATGLNASASFQSATEPLRAYGATFAALPADQQRYIKTSYGTIELTDGVTESTLEAIGHLRANAAGVQAVVQRLEHDSLSLDPQMNTEVAVLNKLNAASIIALRSAHDTNGLLVALAEQETVRAKRTRDAEARAINQHIRFVSEAKPVMLAQTTGASDAMRRWRMP